MRNFGLPELLMFLLVAGVVLGVPGIALWLYIRGRRRKHEPMTKQPHADPREFGEFPALRPVTASPPIPSPAPGAALGAWFYSKNNVREGPVQESEVAGLIQRGEILRETLVWTFGLQDWIPASQTKLAGLFFVPPPLTGKAIRNTYVWILAFAPIIGYLGQVEFASLYRIEASRLWYLTAILNSVLCVVDFSSLTHTGHDISKFWGWFWFVPIYLYQRAVTLRQSKSYLVVWIISFVISLLLLI